MIDLLLTKVHVNPGHIYTALHSIVKWLGQWNLESGGT